MKTLIKTAGTASLLALAVAGTTAKADPLAQLYFSQNAGFVDPVVEFNEGALFEGDFTGPTGPEAPANTYTKFDWYGTDPNVRSSIEIQSYNDSTSPTTETPGGAQLKFDQAFAADASPDEWNLGDWWVIDTLTQTNNVLQSAGGAISDPLWVLDSLANLRIFSDAARLDQIFIDENSATRFDFYETLNTDEEENCDTDNPLGTLCDDVFSVIAAELDPVTFNYNGFKYSINFTLLPGVSTDGQGNVEDLQSTVVENDDGTISVFTPELNPGTSSIHILAQYTAREITVPEPAILGLFSVGMLGLGMAARRRRKPS